MEDIIQIQRIIEKCKQKIDSEDKKIETLQTALLEAEEIGYNIKKDSKLQEINAKCEYCKGYQQAYIDIIKIATDARAKLTVLNSKKLHEIK